MIRKNLWHLYSKDVVNQSDMVKQYQLAQLQQECSKYTSGGPTRHPGIPYLSLHLDVQEFIQHGLTPHKTSFNRAHISCIAIFFKNKMPKNFSHKYWLVKEEIKFQNTIFNSR